MKRLRTFLPFLLVGLCAALLTGCQDDLPAPPAAKHEALEEQIQADDAAKRQAVEDKMQIAKGPDGHDYIVYREEYYRGFKSATLAVGLAHSQECSHPRCKGMK